MTSDDIRAFFTRFLTVWERENLKDIGACYRPDARIDSPMFHTISGSAEIEKSFNDLFRAFDEWSFRIDDIVIDQGDGGADVRHEDRGVAGRERK